MSPRPPNWPPSRGAVLSRERRALALAHLASPRDPEAVYLSALVLATIERDQGLGRVGHMVRVLLDLATVTEALVRAEPWPEDRGTDVVSREVAVRVRALADRLHELADRLTDGGA